MSILIRLNNIGKVYQTGEITLAALRNINLQVKSKEFLAIMGVSGSGKSTLMNIIGLLDHSTTGKYYLEGQDVSLMGDDQLAKVRNQKIGFVFQSFNLLPRTSALDNVAIPLIYAGVKPSERKQKAREVLEQMGLGDKLLSRPNQLSGGQQQRVAIARALVNNPEVILADEPTGNLDSQSGEEIMKIFDKLNQKGKTIILITHEANIARHAKKVIRIKDGEIWKP